MEKLKVKHDKEAQLLKGIILDKDKAVEDIKNERENDLKNQLEELEQIRVKYADVTKTKKRPAALDPRMMLSLSDNSKEIPSSVLSIK